MNPSFRLFEKASTAFSNNEVSRPSGDEDRRFAARKENDRLKPVIFSHSATREVFSAAYTPPPKMDL